MRDSSVSRDQDLGHVIRAMNQDDTEFLQAASSLTQQHTNSILISRHTGTGINVVTGPGTVPSALLGAIVIIFHSKMYGLARSYAM